MNRPNIPSSQQCNFQTYNYNEYSQQQQQQQQQQQHIPNVNNSNSLCYDDDTSLFVSDATAMNQTMAQNHSVYPSNLPRFPHEAVINAGADNVVDTGGQIGGSNSGAASAAANCNYSSSPYQQQHQQQIIYPHYSQQQQRQPFDFSIASSSSAVVVYSNSNEEAQGQNAHQTDQLTGGPFADQSTSVVIASTRRKRKKMANAEDDDDDAVSASVEQYVERAMSGLNIKKAHELLIQICQKKGKKIAQHRNSRESEAAQCYSCIRTLLVRRFEKISEDQRGLLAELLADTTGRTNITDWPQHIWRKHKSCPGAERKNNKQKPNASFDVHGVSWQWQPFLMVLKRLIPVGPGLIELDSCCRYKDEKVMSNGHVCINPCHWTEKQAFTSPAAAVSTTDQLHPQKQQLSLQQQQQKQQLVLSHTALTLQSDSNHRRRTSYFALSTAKIVGADLELTVFYGPKSMSFSIQELVLLPTFDGIARQLMLLNYIEKCLRNDFVHMEVDLMPIMLFGLTKSLAQLVLNKWQREQQKQRKDGGTFMETFSISLQEILNLQNNAALGSFVSFTIPKSILNGITVTKLQNGYMNFHIDGFTERVNHDFRRKMRFRNGNLYGPGTGKDHREWLRKIAIDQVDKCSKADYSESETVKYENMVILWNGQPVMTSLYKIVEPDGKKYRERFFELMNYFVSLGISAQDEVQLRQKVMGELIFERHPGVYRVELAEPNDNLDDLENLHYRWLPSLEKNQATVAPRSAHTHTGYEYWKPLY